MARGALVAAATAAFAAMAAAMATSRALRIMPLGDSITEWRCDNTSQGGYRHFLGDSLIAADVSFDFVGARYGCGSHSGFSGWTAEQLNGVAAEIVTAHQPDIVLVQAGTNDLFYNQPNYTARGANVTGTLARLQALVSTIYSVAPQATVLLSGVTYINATRCADYPQAPWNPPACPPDMQPNIVQLNALMPAMVAQFAQAGRAIAWHDPNPACNFTASDYFTWGIHFSESGYAKIANAWFTALKPFVA